MNLSRTYMRLITLIVEHASSSCNLFLVLAAVANQLSGCLISAISHFVGGGVVFCS